MNNVPRTRFASKRSARLTTREIFSDYTPTSGVKFLALVLALKSDHSSYGGGVRWPALKLDEICEKLNKSKPTVKKMIADLKKVGLLKVTRVKYGCVYEVVFPDFQDDTFRGKPNPRSEAATLVSVDLITSDISDGAFHLLLMLESTQKNYRSIKNVSQEKLRTYFKSRRIDLKKDKSDLHVSVRQLNTWLRELEAIGVLERSQSSIDAINEYFIHKDEHIVNGVNLAPDEETIKWETGPDLELVEFDGYSVEHEKFRNAHKQPRQDWREEEDGYPEEGYMIGGGADYHGSLSKELELTIVGACRENGFRVRPGDVDLASSAALFKRLLADGVGRHEIRDMIERYPDRADLSSDKPLWVDFAEKFDLVKLAA